MFTFLPQGVQPADASAAPTSPAVTPTLSPVSSEGGRAEDRHRAELAVKKAQELERQLEEAKVGLERQKKRTAQVN